MTLYSYLALGANGEEHGMLEAADERAARQELRNRGVRVLDLAEGATTAGGLAGVFGQLALLAPRHWLPVRAHDQVQFFRQAALMLGSGHTVIETLEATARLSTKASMQAVLMRLTGLVEGGSSLSAAMAKEKRAFTPFMVRLVEAGEAGGELDRVMAQLADDTERKMELRRQMITALAYPSIVIILSIGVVAFLITGVIPKFAKFLTDRGKDLPWAAADLMAIADFIMDWGPMVGLVLVAAVAALFVVRSTERGRQLTDRAWLALPVAGGVILATGMAQAAWTLALLLNSGLTVMDSLHSAAMSSRNRALGASLEQAARQVLEGKRLSVALDQPVFPALLRHMAAVGERSGELVAVMEQVGLFYRKELDARIKLMTAMVEPALILFVGSIVGFVYFAFFQAMFAVSLGGR